MTHSVMPIFSGRILTPITVTINNADSTAAVQTYTFIDRSTALLNGKVVRKLGFYSLTARNVTLKIAKRNSLNNYDVVVGQVFAHGGTGWEDFIITSPFFVPASGDYYLAGYVAAGGANPNIKGAAALRTYAGPGIDLTGTGVVTTGEDSMQAAYPMRYTYTQHL